MIPFSLTLCSDYTNKCKFCYHDPAEASVSCQVARTATATYTSVRTAGRFAELQ